MTTSRQPSEAYPRSGMCECVRFHVKLSLHIIMVSYELILISEISLIMHSLINIHVTVNSCAESKLNYYKASGIYIAKNKPLKSKLRKIKKAINSPN